MPSFRTVAGVTLFFGCVLSCAAGVAEDGSRTVDNLVQNIIALRGDLEALDARLQRLESGHEARISSMARREGELAAQSERQELNIEQLTRKLAGLRKRTQKAGVAAEQLTPALNRAIDGMRQYVETSLPFTRGERLAALNEIETQLHTGAVDPPRLANHLWSFYADEIRLTSGSALYRQPIVIAGRERLADVARLGMMSLYFRAEDGRFGYAARAADDWAYRYLDDAPADNVAALFGALRKQLNTGFFMLPHPISEAALARTNRTYIRQAEAQP